MKTQNMIYETPEEKPYAHKPTIGFNADVSKKPDSIYGQSNIGFLAEKPKKDKPGKIKIYHGIPSGLEDMLHITRYGITIGPAIIPQERYI